MCLVVAALGVSARHELLFAANRDERHARPSEAAHWWLDAPGRARRPRPPRARHLARGRSLGPARRGHELSRRAARPRRCRAARSSQTTCAAPNRSTSSRQRSARAATTTALSACCCESDGALRIVSNRAPPAELGARRACASATRPTASNGRRYAARAKACGVRSTRPIPSPSCSRCSLSARAPQPSRSDTRPRTSSRARSTALAPRPSSRSAGTGEFDVRGALVRCERTDHERGPDLVRIRAAREPLRRPSRRSQATRPDRGDLGRADRVLHWIDVPIDGVARLPRAPGAMPRPARAGSPDRTRHAP